MGLMTAVTAVQCYGSNRVHVGRGGGRRLVHFSLAQSEPPRGRAALGLARARTISSIRVTSPFSGD